MQHAQPAPAKRHRGFAAMDAQKQREIARKGGQAAHQKGTAHEFTADEARQAGRKGGERVSANRAHMAQIGRVGGRSSAARRQSPQGAGEETDDRGGGNGNGNGNGSSRGRPEEVEQGSPTGDAESAME